MKGKNCLFCVLLFALGICMFVHGEEKADILIKNGRIYTVDPQNRVVSALAARGGRILALGSDQDLEGLVGSETQVIDLKGAPAYPGLIDSHGHFMSLGYSRMQLDLTRTRSWEEIVEMVRQAAAEAGPGEWIQGRGWHQEKWDKAPEPNVQGLPIHTLLSRAAPDHPVVLTHASGHSCLANAKAMELGGVNRDTPNPAGGEIIRDSEGKAIGAFLETAQGLVRRAMGRYETGMTAQMRKERELKALRLASEECLQKGITSFHDAGVSFSTIDLYKELAEAKKLKVRINAMLGVSNAELKKRINEYRIVPNGDCFLTVHTIKRLIDGALGPHGAWLLQPYDSLPDSVGLNTESIAVMKETAEIAIKNGFQLSTHAIGDRANRETLDIYEEAFKAYPDKKDLRWRIEHAQHLHPGDIPRFGRLGIIASMQAIHCTSDGPWVLKRLGEKRAEDGAYVWRKLLDSGARICNGTDVPVEAVDPMPNFYAAISRKMNDGTGFFPGQCMTREEALRSYTINGAYAAFEEKLKGSLEKGKLADIVVLSRDIMKVPEDEIPGTEVLYTIVDGRIAYKK